ncbi:MAG: hypothetical protein IMF20_00455 [Proteobacteria bacterium]|nr:hypothetical protein [Pseudomonadota bacterium]
MSNLTEPTYKHYSIHALGYLQYLQRFPDYDQEPFMKRLRRCRPRTIGTFNWCGDPSPGNAYHFKHVPWKMVKADGRLKADFDQWNPLWEDKLIELNQACKAWDMHDNQILFMDRYNYHLFKPEWNVQGINGFFSPEAREVQKKYAVHCMELAREGRGYSKYKPYLTLCNEPGSRRVDVHRMGHVWAEWHRDIYDAVIPYTERQRITVNSSDFCEYAHADLIEPGRCAYWDHPTEPCTHIFGREGQKRDILIEGHGVSKLQSFIEKGFAGIGAWPAHVWSEDGAWENIANKRELFKALDFCIRTYLNMGKEFYFIGWMFNVEVDGKEDYADLSRIRWGRLKQFDRVMRRMG